MSSPASVHMYTNPVSSMGPSSLKTMRVLSSNWLAEQLSTRKAHLVVMNSRTLLFQTSNTTGLVSEIKNCPSESRMICLAMIALLLSIFYNTSSLDTSVYVRHTEPLEVILYSNTAGAPDFRPEMKTIFDILALCRRP